MSQLRKVTVQNAEQLVELWVETFQQAYAGVHSPEDIAAYSAANFTLEAATSELSNPQTVCCFGFRENEPCGYYVVRHHACPVPRDGKSSELKQIYVLASEYGTGLGRSLYEHAIDTVRAAGSAWVWLNVSDINYRAQAFYSKLGFQKLGVGPVFQVGSERLASSLLARKV